MDKKGFTLTEMIAVIVIVGIVIIIAIPASRRLIINNQQEKIDIKEKTVEKAIVTYANVENNKYDCVQLKIQELIDKGYIKEDDLNTTKYRDKNIFWYFYKNSILESPPSEVTCNVISNNSISNADETDNDYEDVTVPIEEEKRFVTVKVERDDTGFPYPDLITYSPVIQLSASKGGSTISIKTGDSASCTSTECTLEVPKGASIGYSVVQRAYKMGETTSTNSNGNYIYTVKLVSALYSFQVYPKYYWIKNNSTSGSYWYVEFGKSTYAGCLTSSSSLPTSCSSYSRKVAFVAVSLSSYYSVSAGDTINFKLGTGRSLGSSGTTYNVGSMQPYNESYKLFYVDSETSFYQIIISGTRVSTSKNPNLKAYITIYYY